MRVGKMITRDHRIIDGVAGEGRWQERMLIRGLAATLSFAWRAGKVFFWEMDTLKRQMYYQEQEAPDRAKFVYRKRRGCGRRRLLSMNEGGGKRLVAEPMRQLAWS
jgi:hypothetical protein